MIINCFPTKVTPQKARALAEKRNGIFSRLITKSKNEDIEMRTLYIENRLITFDIISKPSLLERLFKKNAQPRRTKIEMIANGSTCGVAYYDRRGVEVVEKEVEENDVQLSDFSDADMIVRGNALARRILRRRVGGNIALEVNEIKSLFRPYHIAFFGKAVEGRKLYYIPLAADGCSVKRTF